MGVLFSAPQHEYECIKREWLAGVQTLAQKGVFVGGQTVKRFEDSFARYIGARHAVGVGNGTDALYLALKALNIGPGDEVITVANTFIATVEAIHHTGARPVLVDCDPDTYLIDIEQVQKRITSRTKAIIPVHLYGQMVEMESLLRIADEKGLSIIEDSAQAAGAELNGRKAGSIGHIGCFSFYPDKNLGALGDGGGITTSDDHIASRLRKLRNHGGESRYEHDLPGFNSRLDPLQALALQIKLNHLDSWSELRRNNAECYQHYLQGGQVILPRSRGDRSHVYHLYVIRVEAEIRDPLKKHLQKKGILTAIQYPLPVHLTKAFEHLGYQRGDFPWSEQYAEQILSLPMHIALREEDIAFISQQIKEFVGTF
jgi:dTDP-4-amino-4,6-dideoxygalactose transaminase